MRRLATLLGEYFVSPIRARPRGHAGAALGPPPRPGGNTTLLYGATREGMIPPEEFFNQENLRRLKMRQDPATATRL